MLKHKILLFMGTIILGGFLSGGCGTGLGGSASPFKDQGIIFTRGEGEQIAISVEVRNNDETRWFFGTKFMASKAELWLKFGIEDSEVFCLVPLNVKDQSGHNTTQIITPFKFKENQGKTITVELLDDDKLSKKEIELLNKTVKAAGYLLCDGVNVYAKTQATENLISNNTKELIAECLSQGIILTVENMKSFDSLGHRDFLIDNSIADQKWISMPLTIVDKNDIARCDLRFHLIATGK